MRTLENKVAVVIGGNSGIGLASARAFTDAGARVAILGRNRKTLDEASRAIDGALVAQGDVTDPKTVENFYADVAAKLGRFDVLFLNAGVAKFAPVEATTEEFYDEVFDINVKGIFFAARSALPYLNDGASVILNTSVANSVGLPGASVYAASKAALRSLAKTFSAEWVGRGIRVNAISPGPIATPIYDRLPKEVTASLTDTLLPKVPMKRFGEPEEVANAVLFFASPAASYVTGTELRVSGGLGEL